MSAAAATNKRKRTRSRRTRTAIYEDGASSSSSSSSSSSDDEGSSDSDCTANNLKGKEKLKDDNGDVTMNRASDSSDDDSDSDSDSDSSSSSSSGSSLDLTLPRGKRRTATAIAAVAAVERASAAAAFEDSPTSQARPDPSAITGPANATASTSMRKPLPPQEKVAAVSATELLSGRARRTVLRQQERERERSKRARFTPSPSASDDDGDDGIGAASGHLRGIEKLHGRSLPPAEEMFSANFLPPLPRAKRSLGLAPEKEEEIAAMLELRQRIDVALATKQASYSSDGDTERAHTTKQRDETEQKALLEAQEEKKEMFRDIWMKAVAEEFGEELNNLRQREPALTEVAGRLPLLIDSLRSGADVFRMGTKSKSSDGRNNADIDEVQVVLEANERAQQRCQQIDASL
ncbi:hypothetical protein K437DRAFT_269921 [Tilletiaria anomala UBC 951]|uniref:Ribosome assembly protein 3 n=1 Tax=Tilletiaria anomala (strain ATCC 24038 / CBS 436.72 / UBC 951) TaxID=1037660 RepID=A0A066VG37_TILAU|nr:uncharacterized protein K437DRAFT_269921 [Tilletiaria anomala UBC 951]KDN40702.1 hypothetical protein K437DRAFT_269921 [Tilletiaria anomala UBC 951]